jgi:hypothetical protein
VCAIVLQAEGAAEGQPRELADAGPAVLGQDVHPSVHDSFQLFDGKLAVVVDL